VSIPPSWHGCGPKKNAFTWPHVTAVQSHITSWNESWNALLQAIDLPFVLTPPVDLTPSLLIIELESIPQVSIPIAHVIDQQDKNRHIQTIKVFIGVVEVDFLQMNIGLSNLDPRLLAAGAWYEVVSVPEALCWIGEELNLIQPVPVLDKGIVQDQVKK